MAEFAIRAFSTSHADPETDSAGAYKAGDLVDVMPDGHVWGASERFPRFYILKLPGISTDIARKYLESPIDPFLIRPKTILRRRFRLMVENVPPAMISADGVIATTWNTVRQYIWDKSTGATLLGKAF